jgi:protein-tyrosine-phosphatase
VHTIIFICTGNMCRSPMAEGILRSKLTELGRNDVAVSSMGIHAPRHQKASPDSIVACAEYDVDISEHISRQLVFDELQAADFIFVMENFHREYIRTFVPQASDRLFLLDGWPGNGKNAHGIPDPIGGKPKDYQRTFALISSHIDRILPFLLAESL